MSDDMERVITRALIHVIENQITIKERLGIIKFRDRKFDSEYDHDMDILEDILKTN